MREQQGSISGSLQGGLRLCGDCITLYRIPSKESGSSICPKCLWDDSRMHDESARDIMFYELEAKESCEAMQK